MSFRRALRTVTCALALAGLSTPAFASPAALPAPVKEQPAQVAWAPAVKPKALSENVQKGLDWLVAHQLNDGGWGQGEESANMGSAMAGIAGQSNVADTCMSALALLRAGSTPTEGAHAKNINRGIDFVLGQIEASDENSLSVTSINGTRVQAKIGPNVDTFLSAQMLAEVDGKMGDPDRNARVRKALDKVLAKMEKNQRDDGGYAGNAWAPALSQAIATKGVNRAAQKGAKVSKQLRVRSEGWAKRKFNAEAKSFDGADSAGVGLYAAAASVGGLADSNATNAAEEVHLEKVARESPDEAVRANAKADLDRIAETRQAQTAAQNALVAKMSDQQFMAGFGSNGGEEFLSYMLVSESLVAKGGTEWKEWDATMARNLGHVQNKDGSWTGHHCITGRNFCTAAALLVLMADRAPMPLAKELRRG
ncbi:MAG: hypothetical protein KC620_10475 [Myxococcales bacterium]|nr:hypothetical protein [Myxococcales bacterium]